MTSSETARIKAEILEKGFWAQNNAHIGKLVDNIVRTDHDLYTEAGLNLWAAVIHNELVSDVLKSFFPRPIFTFCRTFGKTKSKHCITNRTADDVRVLVVFCWSSESAGVMCAGSHSQYLGAEASKNSLLSIPDGSLNHPNITTLPFTMDYGGLSIVDARCGWQIDKGETIFLGFVTPDELRFWFPLVWPTPFKDAVIGMVGNTMDINLREKN